MQQLTQKLKNGDMRVLEVPVPALMPGSVLVRNRYSLISSGTEGSTVRAARAGYIAKAKERPQQVRQVLDTLRAQGFSKTYQAVMKKLDALSPLGYSSAGQVIDVAPDVTAFAVGDFVACAGLSACHAEIVSVPVNLCVKLDPGADLKQAAYNTLGVIAMQGVRQADVRLGECCAVIGLGLVGQLTALILRAAGVRVVGIDTDPAMAEIAGKHCADLALARNRPGIERGIHEFTGGLGCDAVIIAAAADSLDPVNFAGAIARKRGTVVVVGGVPTGFDRDPDYYRKELQLRMSCSYGPGRYDPLYEEKGIDYPAAYVRWTENRNMAAFQELLRGKRIDVGYLTTHVFPLEKAADAYDLLVEKTSPFIGILIEYDADPRPSIGRCVLLSRPAPSSGGKASARIGFLGAGSYAQGSLLPNIPKRSDVELAGVMTATGTGARTAAERFGFGLCTTDAGKILDDDRINVVFIASRHESHGEYVLKALAAGKHVFVEKPVCHTEEGLAAIADAWENGRTPGGARPLLMAGFNRRFSPLSRALRETIGPRPMAMTYRINAGFVPRESWIQDPGAGGRIVGEACHFIDYLTWLNGSLPVSVHAAALPSSVGIPDTVTMTFTFRNGSIGAVSYFSNGDKSLPKERVELFADGVTAVIDDFRSLVVHAAGRRTEKRLSAQDKGQKEMVRRFVDAACEGGECPIPSGEAFATTLATFKALESLRTGNRVPIHE